MVFKRLSWKWGTTATYISNTDFAVFIKHLAKPFSLESPIVSVKIELTRSRISRVDLLFEKGENNSLLH